MLQSMSLTQLRDLEQQVEKKYQDFCEQHMNLDLTRGKPNRRQLDLSNPMNQSTDHYVTEDGTDLRNYGALSGIQEAKKLGAELLGLSIEEILVGGNSSLTLMYRYLLSAHFYGVRGRETAWMRSGEKVSFLCPCPGYDRHFTMCQDLGIEMIPIRLTEEGPDMDQVEALVAEDESIKGMWCVPKFSNPTGHVYSDRVIDRLARLGTMASPYFRIIYDNAYAFHDVEQPVQIQANIMDRCRVHGTEDSVIMTCSTSKITFAGAGVCFMGASKNNLTEFINRLKVSTLGFDKVNQWRHVQFLKNKQGLLNHMADHAAIIKPKFDLANRHLQTALGGMDMGDWTKPRGGYFVSFDTRPGLAKEVVRLAGTAGVKLTPAGATFPYGNDPENQNIRIAPTYPSEKELDQAMSIFTTCVQLASVRHELTRRH